MLVRYPGNPVDIRTLGDAADQIPSRLNNRPAARNSDSIDHQSGNISNSGWITDGYLLPFPMLAARF